MRTRIYIVVLVILALLPSCDKKGAENDSRYYVRYTGTTSTLHIVETMYTVATDTGIDTYKTTGASSDYSVTVGPVKAGFQASIACKCDETESYYIKSQRVTIEVSKNGEPFAQKASGSDMASYVID